MILTFNKSDRPGEEITVNVNQKTREFTLYDHRFKLEVTQDHSGEVHPLVIYKITCPDWDYPLGKVVHEINNPDIEFWNESYKAWDGAIIEGNLSRYGNNIYEAAAKMLCSVI